MKKKILSAILTTAVVFTCCAGCGNGQSSTESASSAESETDKASAEVSDPESTASVGEEYNFTMKMSDIPTGDVSSSGVAVHDPSILEADGTYYIFGSHMTAARSDDLLHWEMIADGYTKTNPVYGQIYDVADEAFAYAGSGDSLIESDDDTVHVWAPDVIYNETTGLYYMYYCTSSTWNASTICFGTSETPEGPYTWQKNLIYSGFNFGTIDATDVTKYVDKKEAQRTYIKNGAYNYEDYPNAIDPTAFYDADGRMWMVYGSWSGGIFLIELDPETGDVIHPEADPENNVDAYYGKRLLGGGHISIEGPYILYDEESGCYYLYVSYGSLTSNGGYQIRVFRSKTPDGEYVDMNGAYPGKSAEHSAYGLKISGNYKLPSLEKAYMATGHNSAFIDTDGKKYIVYHTRFNDGGEGHSPRVHQYFLNAEGWPCELPYQTQGETISEDGYDKADLVGRYFMTLSGTDISSDINNPFIVYLNEDGTLIGREVSGTWEEQDGSYLMNLTVDGTSYSGVFCAMKDEAGADVMTFSAVGENQTAWGVKYADQ